MDQVNAVGAALSDLGIRHQVTAISDDVDELRRAVAIVKPDIVFNLVEAVGGDPVRCAEVPDLLDALGVPVTGNSAAALTLTADKRTTKARLSEVGIATPGSIDLPGLANQANRLSGPYFVKSASEDASLGLDSCSICHDLNQVQERIAYCRNAYGGAWFAEQFIEGREFNIAILSGPHGPQVLPIAEIDFTAFPENMPRIVDYAAKWDQDSFGYNHTPRAFLQPEDSRLVLKLANLALQCWRELGLFGYARVDLRMDAQGKPWVLEANANPCLSPDAGFAAAAAHAQLDMSGIVSRLLVAGQTGRQANSRSLACA